MPTRWPFTSAFLASVHCPSASLRHPGFACFRSPLVGTGIPALVNNGCCRKPGTEVTGPARRLMPRPRPPPSLPPGDRKSPMSISRTPQTLALWRCAPGKPGRKPGLSVKPEVANEHQQNVTNLVSCPRPYQAVTVILPSGRLGVAQPRPKRRPATDRRTFDPQRS